MEQEEEKKKKLNDDVIAFIRKRSETEAPRYTARLKTYVDIQQKHRRAAAARQSDHGYRKLQGSSRSRKKLIDTDEKAKMSTDNAGGRSLAEKEPGRVRSTSRSGSGDPSEGCCRRRRRRKSCRRRRRRRSCRRRRRRRRSCGRRRRRRRSRRRRRRRC